MIYDHAITSDKSQIILLRINCRNQPMNKTQKVTIIICDHRQQTQKVISGLYAHGA